MYITCVSVIAILQIVLTVTWAWRSLLNQITKTCVKWGVCHPETTFSKSCYVCTVYPRRAVIALSLVSACLNWEQGQHIHHLPSRQARDKPPFLQNADCRQQQPHRADTNENMTSCSSHTIFLQRRSLFWNHPRIWSKSVSICLVVVIIFSSSLLTSPSFLRPPPLSRRAPSLLPSTSINNYGKYVNTRFSSSHVQRWRLPGRENAPAKCQPHSPSPRAGLDRPNFRHGRGRRGV